jgi:hypothetical protein
MSVNEELACYFWCQGLVTGGAGFCREGVGVVMPVPVDMVFWTDDVIGV